MHENLESRINRRAYDSKTHKVQIIIRVLKMKRDAYISQAYHVIRLVMSGQSGQLMTFSLDNS